MADKEKVIKGLECCLKEEHPYENPCNDCPYNYVDSESDGGFCTERTQADALELIKEQDERIKFLERTINVMPKPVKLLDVFGDHYEKIVRCKDCKMNNQCSIQFKFADADNPGNWFCAYGNPK